MKEVLIFIFLVNLEFSGNKWRDEQKWVEKGVIKYIHIWGKAIREKRLIVIELIENEKD